MNYEDARHILGLPHVWDLKSLNKAFRSQAKRYHPDKNKSAEANLEFDLVRRAYEYLLVHDPSAAECKQAQKKDEGEVFYKELLNQFNDAKVAKLYSACKEVVSTAKDLLHDWKSKKQGCLFEHTIKVSLSQMLNDEMYVLKHKDESFYVPLWYPSVSFELESGDMLCANIDVDLPRECSVDDNNQLSVVVDTNSYKSFDVKQFLSPRCAQYDQQFDLSLFPSGASFTLPSAGLLRVDDSSDVLNIKDRQSVTFLFK
jgi:hypothetical protein